MHKQSVTRSRGDLWMSALAALMTTVRSPYRSVPVTSKKHQYRCVSHDESVRLQMTKVHSKMSDISRKLSSAAASLATLILVSSSAHAQTDVLTGISGTSFIQGQSITTYTFSSSMILNSIGFYTNGDTPQSLSYSINGASQSVDLNSLSTEVSGFRWLTLSNPTTILQNQSVAVTTLGKNYIGRARTHYVSGFTVNASSNVSSVTMTGFSDIRSNSNLRVSAYNPGSNVAPEPGTFALALTGGGALLGICIRRRRIAG